MAYFTSPLCPESLFARFPYRSDEYIYIRHQKWHQQTIHKSNVQLLRLICACNMSYMSCTWPAITSCINNLTFLPPVQESYQGKWFFLSISSFPWSYIFISVCVALSFSIWPWTCWMRREDILVKAPHLIVAPYGKVSDNRTPVKMSKFGNFEIKAKILNYE